MKRLILLLLLIAAPCFATDYHIGTGQTYTTIGAAPWSSLVAGDNVYIHAKAGQTPYYEHLYLSAALQGTQANPISIIGVPDGSGNLPILDGTGSTTGTNFNTYGLSQYHSQLGIVVFGPSATGGSTSAPQWVTVSKLKIQNYKGVSTTDETGATTAGVSGAGVYLQGGQHVTLDGVDIVGCADGIFGKDNGSPVKYVTVKNSYVHGNGVSGDYLYHNVYTEIKYVTFEGNRFDPPVSGSPGNNIKDRSAGFVFRYNWVNGGQHLLDIVECQDNCTDHTTDAAWNDSFVYGNIFYAGPGAAGQLFHLGSGDNGAATSVWRKNLYFYDNTVHVKRDQSESYYVNFFQITGSQQNVYLNNNIFYKEPATVGQPSPEIYLQYDSSTALGNMTIGPNWLNSGWYTTKPGVTLSGTVTGLSNLITTGSPSFASLSGQDYNLTAGSAAIGAAGSLPSLISTGNWTGTDLTPTQQYLTQPRTSLADLGAFMYSGAPVTPPPAAPPVTKLSGKFTGRTFR